MDKAEAMDLLSPKILKGSGEEGSVDTKNRTYLIDLILSLR